MSDSAEFGDFKLVPKRENPDGTVTRAGDEIFVRGIGKRLLGIGTYAGELISAGESGDESMPILEVQGELVSGGRVDLWSTAPELIDRHRDEVVYPIGLYLSEMGAKDAEIIKLTDEALASEMGIELD